MYRSLYQAVRQHFGAWGTFAPQYRAELMGAGPPATSGSKSILVPPPKRAADASSTSAGRGGGSALALAHAAAAAAAPSLREIERFVLRMVDEAQGGAAGHLIPAHLHPPGTNVREGVKAVLLSRFAMTCRIRIGSLNH